MTAVGVRKGTHTGRTPRTTVKRLGTIAADARGVDRTRLGDAGAKQAQRDQELQTPNTSVCGFEILRLFHTAAQQAAAWDTDWCHDGVYYCRLIRMQGPGVCSCTALGAGSTSTLGR